ncbi:MAG TPA: outer membrane beta-barrel protein [Chitinophagaceae bacterium]|nr:outer membrane beta-barrel protein [Chitinophagaceae bacterium]
MKKTFFVTLVAVMAAAASSAQSFMHGAGLNVFVATAAGGKAAVNGGVTYSPRFNFIEQPDMSVSIGIPFTVGVSGSYSASYSSQYGSSSSNTLSVMFNAPLLVNLNMGAGASKESESRFGYFVGAGFGYHYGTYNLSDIINYEETSSKFSTMGPVGNAGVRFAVGSGTHNIEVRFQFMKGINDVKPNIYSAGAAFNF